jgi:hypothetical protein
MTAFLLGELAGDDEARRVVWGAPADMNSAPFDSHPNIKVSQASNMCCVRVAALLSLVQGMMTQNPNPKKPQPQTFNTMLALYQES